jgi:AcrR family transcriptional regulator
MRTAPPGGRGRPRGTGDETRSRILDAAVELFARHGFDGTSVRAIAGRCAISDPALYYHFGSKRAILQAVWEESAFESVAPGEPDEVTRESLLQSLERLVDGWTKQPALIAFVLRRGLQGDPDALAFRAQAKADNLRLLVRPFVRLYGERGEILADIVLSTLRGLLVDAALEHGVDSFAEAMHEAPFQDRLRRVLEVVVPPAVPAPEQR